MNYFPSCFSSEDLLNEVPTMSNQFHFQNCFDNSENAELEKNSNSNIVPCEPVSGVTNIKSNKFSFLWTINNFKKFLDRKYEFTSPIFFGKISSGTSKWKMIVHPENIYPEGIHLGLRLVVLSEIDKSYSVMYTISFIDGTGKLCPLKTREKVFRHCLDFDECPVISNINIKKQNFISNESLIIKCEFDLLECENLDDINTVPIGNLDTLINRPCESLHRSANKSYEIPIDVNHQNGSVNIPAMAQSMNDLSYSATCKKPSESEKHVNAFIEKDNVLENNSEEFDVSNCKNKGLEILSYDLKQLYFNTHQHDVVIYVDDGKHTAHEVILTSRSDYFKKALISQHKEVTVPGITTDTLDAVLYYLYTGKLKQVTENCALDILKAAKLMELPCLENMTTETFLSSRIGVNNVTNVFLMAKELKIESLKNSSLKFMAENRDEIMKSEPWNKLMKNDPHSAGEVLLTIAYFQNKVGNNASV